MIDGFFVMDKPAGITSHDVVSRVRRILGTRRVGHTGTLDPFATGVLPVAVNQGTKVIPFLDEGVKAYDALLRLGVVTDTLDMTGTVLRQGDWSRIDRASFQAAAAGFTGSISQLPPMFSAIKQGGQPLYRLARQGVEVQRSPRRVEIHSLELASFDPPFARLLVTCSRGTYIRSLADDIGTALGCGAALQELRRVASGPFRLASAVSLETLEEYSRAGRLPELCVTPLEALAHLPEIPLSEAGYGLVIHGRSPGWLDTTPGAPAPVEPLQLLRLSRGGALVAVAQCGTDCGPGMRLTLRRVMV